MRIIDRHIEYLIRRHDCVIVPGIGAFLCRYKPAAFDVDGKQILPPGRELAFNKWLTESDGLLAASVGRALDVSVEEALSFIDSEIKQLLSQLDSEKQVSLGRLGILRLTDSGEITFDPALNIAGVNGSFYGLFPISPKLIEASNRLVEKRVPVPIPDESEIKESTGSRRFGWLPSQWRAYASGIVATVAVLLTLAFFVLSPIRIDKNAQTASIAPVAGSYMKSVDNLADFEYAAHAVVVKDSVSAIVSPMATDTVQAISVTEAGMSEREPDMPEIRFNDADPYFVIVASFPTMTQANSYVKSHPGSKLGILQMDGRCRVYAATGADYAMASSMTALVNEADAWICRR